MFIVSLIGMFLGQYMDGNVFYKMCVIMTVLAAAILSAERFILEKKWEEICQKHLRSVTG